jgi:protein SCO1/2
MTAGLRTVQDPRGEPDVEFVTVTVDPENDTPDVLRLRRSRGGASPRWHWLTGDKAAIFKLV